MATQRHQSSAELPPAPLDFAFPLAVPGAEVQGAVILFEAPAPFSLHLFQALRYVTAWAQWAAHSGELFDDETGERPWAEIASIAKRVCDLLQVGSSSGCVRCQSRSSSSRPPDATNAASPSS